jgi:hypothetical protein
VYSLEARGRVCARETARAPRSSILESLLLVVALAVGGQLLWPVLAAADGTIFALVTLTNNSSFTLTIPSSGASTPQLFGLPSGASDFGMPAPGGLPATMLGPGATTVFGTMSNGGFLATTGTGGKLIVPAANQTISWSAPWGVFNGLFDYCGHDITANGSSGGSTFTGSPTVTISGGFVSYGYNPNTCLFSFVAN